MEKNYSVLMSVYFREKPEFLNKALKSIAEQTVHPSEIVMVCDGELTDELNEVLSIWEKHFNGLMKIIRLPENRGLGAALNIGLSHCSCELVARMDTDDISMSDRIQRQLDVFESNPDISICSGTVQEFEVSPEEVLSKRNLPEMNAQIVEFCKKRNPFNHPCVMYRKSAVLKAGGYQSFYLLEDYWLWIRMLSTGEKGYNIQDPLLWMRAGSGMYKRRSGWLYVQSQARLFYQMKKMKFITLSEMCSSIIIRTLSALAPNWLRQEVFGLVLRQN